MVDDCMYSDFLIYGGRNVVILNIDCLVCEGLIFDCVYFVIVMC